MQSQQRVWTDVQWRRGWIGGGRISAPRVGFLGRRVFGIRREVSVSLHTARLLCYRRTAVYGLDDGLEVGRRNARAFLVLSLCVGETTWIGAASYDIDGHVSSSDDQKYRYRRCGNLRTTPASTGGAGPSARQVTRRHEVPRLDNCEEVHARDALQVPLADRDEAELPTLPELPVDVLAGDDLARLGLVLDPCRNVHPVAEDVPVSGNEHVTYMDAQAKPRSRHSVFRRFSELRLELDSGADGTISAAELGESGVADKLDEPATARENHAPRRIMESRQERERGSLVDRRKGAVSDEVREPNSGEVALRSFLPARDCCRLCIDENVPPASRSAVAVGRSG